MDAIEATTEAEDQSVSRLTEADKVYAEERLDQEYSIVRRVLDSVLTGYEEHLRTGSSGDPEHTCWIVRKVLVNTMES